MSPPKKVPRVQTIRAADVQPEEIDYLWQDRIPRGTVTLIGGRPGRGKSLFTNYLAAEITRRGGAVVMSNPEDALAYVKVPRLIASEAVTPLIHFWPGKISLPGDVELLEELILFHEVDLVTIDPIAKHIQSRDPNTALEPLVEMAERTGVAIVGVHHTIKNASSKSDPADAFGGASGGWIGTVRSAHIFGTAAIGDEGARYLAQVKSNHGRDDVPAIEFYIDEQEVHLPAGGTTETARLIPVGPQTKLMGREGAQQIVAHVPVDGAGSGEGGERLAAAAEYLTLLLMNGPKPAIEITESAGRSGVSKATLRRAADKIDIVKTRVGFGPGSHVIWALPPTHPFAKEIGDATSHETKDIDDELRKLLGGDDDDE